MVNRLGYYCELCKQFVDKDDVELVEASEEGDWQRRHGDCRGTVIILIRGRRQIEGGGL
ncbi:hypothetical protein BSP36_192 [Bacillus phage BSP36]|uniref:Uncharacterized protein n=1 Tax=Bacillus phage BSP38 TaxID=2283013 RepID=A0A345MK54_BPBSP|nr:hypothetical protein HWB82_gp124 [Bacillus phage BSP38]AXH71236.1 hypothetical protein BSP38_194 [Bacillus phage BSP38]AYJ75279.1 hypothetical protein BSP36_192 [Bacillus phage BSP36]